MTVDFLQQAMMLSVPLILAALGELVSERGGVINIGIEGVMLCGAFAAFAVALPTGSASAGLLAGAAAGTAVAAIFALLTVGWKADQVIVGTGVNLLGLGLTGTMYRAMFGASSAVASVSPLAPVRWPLLSEIPLLGPLVFQQNLMVPFSLALAPVVAWGLYRTRAGLRLRACGENPGAVDTAGYSVGRLRAGGVLIGGALAGLGGAYLSVAAGNTFVEGMANGRGFIALALVIFGRWHPWGILAGAFFFGAAAQVKNALPGLHLPVSAQAIEMVPYAATLLALAFVRQTAAAPAALARPYRR